MNTYLYRIRRLTGFVLISLMTSIMACSSGAPGESAEEVQTDNMTFDFSACNEGLNLVMYDGLDRSFELRLPTSEPKGLPLLIALHSGALTPVQFENYTGLTAEAMDRNFVIAYPEGLTRTWNAGHCCGLAVENQYDDVGFIAEVIENTVDNCHLDSDRVYIMGHSNGAMMTYRFAGERADLISGAAVVSGASGGSRTMQDGTTLDWTMAPPSRGIDIIHLHGTADLNVPFYGGESQAGRDGPRFDDSFQDAFDRVTQYLGCADIVEDTLPVLGLSKAGTNCRDNSQVLFLGYTDKGHGYNDLMDNNGTGANTYILDFFGL